MGAVFSCGKDNDDLINILKVHNYISSKRVEQVFRAVDRRDYIHAIHHDQAYKDISSKVGNIHLSAPCVYCRVMEGLSLKPGLSFLNIGSGTGYLSTMAGLILGENGTNHGIEMHEDCLNYAYKHLEEFKKKSLYMDVFEFCEPVFQHGNFLNVIPNRQYDRVYCGASCPEAYEKFVKQFVKIGGILVMPYEDHLLRIKRTGEKTWSNYTMLPVSFDTLIPSRDGVDDRDLLQLPLWNPRSLQELCRNTIRSHLRKMVWMENSNLEEKKTIKNLSIEQPPPGLGCRIRIPRIDDVVGPYQREVVTTLLRGMGSAIRADYEDDMESEIERLFAPRDCEERNLSQKASNSGTHTEDDDSLEDATEDFSKTKDTQDIEMQEETENEDDDEEKEKEMSKQSGSNYNLSSSSNMKRKNIAGESDESSEDSSIENKTVSHISDSDDSLNEDDVNFVLITKVCSWINGENQRLQSSDGSSDSWTDVDDDNNEHDDNVVLRSSEKKCNDNADTNDNGPENSQLNFHTEQCRSEEIGSKKRVLSSYKCKGNGKNGGIKDHELNEDSSDSSSDDEANERMIYRRDYRAGQKRRSERKTKSSGKNQTSICGKKICESASSTNSTATIISDSDSEANYELRNSKRKQNFARTIRKEAFSSHMKKKINLLPLPPPLQFYINYNREL